jgi:thiamine biosynthesis lipoprotein
MKKHLRVAIIVAIPVMLFAVLYMSRRSSSVVEVDSGYRVVMGTFSRVVVIARREKTAQRCIEAAFEIQDQIESLMSDYRDDSELSKVNRGAAKGPVPVSELTFEVLQKAVHFSRLSDGAFDVTVGPLVDLWRKAGETNEPPTEETLAEARRKVGSDKLILDEKNRTVRFAVEGMRVDLGGIGKGYAVDKAVEAMKKCGARGGLVDLGGNIRCFGQPPQGQEQWRIGLQDPNVAPNEFGGTKPLLILSLTNESVATSGDYRRFVKVHGEKQSHIIDTATGKGANKLVSDTIIAPDATTADALSTAVNVLGLEKGLALVERIAGTAAILIPAGQGVRPIFSRGAGAYIVSAHETAGSGKRLKGDILLFPSRGEK